MTTHREFLFHYRLDGKEWGIAVMAADVTEARERLKYIILVQYEKDVARPKALMSGDKWMDGWPAEKMEL